MELFDDQLAHFIEVGLLYNFISIVLVFVITLFKSMTLSNDDLQRVVAFSHMRQEYIWKYNTSFKRYCAFMMNFVPMYTAVLNAWYLINLLLVSGAKGIINATIKTDRFALVSLVKYDIVTIQDK
jgi:hypothetical protein